MGNTKAEDAMKELTLMLLYLSRFTQGEKFHEATDFYAWKGYDFAILNELDDADYIRQGNHPSRSKSIYITESGMEQAKKLLSKYGINDWKAEWENENDRVIGAYNNQSDSGLYGFPARLCGTVRLDEATVH